MCNISFCEVMVSQIQKQNFITASSYIIQPKENSLKISQSLYFDFFEDDDF